MSKPKNTDWISKAFNDASGRVLDITGFVNEFPLKLAEVIALSEELSLFDEDDEKAALKAIYECRELQRLLPLIYIVGRIDAIENLERNKQS